MSQGFYDRAAPYYDFIYHDLEDYPGDVAFLGAVFRKFALSQPRSILDLGCGTGSHAILLARRGYRVTGLDISRGQLAVARRKVKTARLPVRLVRADMKSFDLGEAFDAAICMFGGFGHLVRTRDVLGCFRSVRAHLRPGSLFIFEFWHTGGVKPSPYQTWFDKKGPGLELLRLSESRFNRGTRVLTIDSRHFIIKDRRLAERFADVGVLRGYTVDEIRRLLRRGRFDLLGAFEATREKKGFRPVRKDTFRVMAIARRRKDAGGAQS